MDLTPLVGGDDRTQGPDDAAVTLVEFGDYQCSYCGQAQPMIKALMSERGDRMRYVFRNFPLSDLHPDAMNAALVAESAETENFWVLHDALYANQDALDPDSLIGYATTSGVSEGDARGGLGGATRSKIVRDMGSGSSSGVQGTPTFFINGMRHEGDWSLEALKQALRKAEA